MGTDCACYFLLIGLYFLLFFMEFPLNILYDQRQYLEHIFIQPYITVIHHYEVTALQPSKDIGCITEQILKFRLLYLLLGVFLRVSTDVVQHTLLLDRVLGRAE